MMRLASSSAEAICKVQLILDKTPAEGRGSQVLYVVLHLGAQALYTDTGEEPGT